jgi:glycine cleavage system transcriptional repressor
MPKKLVITALGADRSGIVNELSNVLYSNQLNIEDSRMSVLGGEFAILLLVSGAADAIDAFVAKCPEIEDSLQMKLTVKTTETRAELQELVAYDVDVVAIDNPGIVHNLASFFSDRQINIMDLETDRYAAPHTGTPMFSLHITIGVPADMAIASLRDDFMTTCDELNLDATLSLVA